MESVDAQPPKTREQVAMEKVIDPFSRPYPLWHATFSRNLPAILRQGIVSSDFIRRSGIGAEIRPQSSWNKDYVSLFNGSARQVWYPKVGIIVEPEDQIVPADESLFEEGKDFYYPYREEMLVKRRIAPREFKGLVIGHTDRKALEEFGQFGRRELYYTNPETGETVYGPVPLEGILSMMQELPSSQALPVYDSIKGLVWPQVLGKDELRKRVVQKAQST